MGVLQYIASAYLSMLLTCEYYSTAQSFSCIYSHPHINMSVSHMDASTSLLGRELSFQLIPLHLLQLNSQIINLSKTFLSNSTFNSRLYTFVSILNILIITHYLPIVTFKAQQYSYLFFKGFFFFFFLAAFCGLRQLRSQPGVEPGTRQ